MARWETHRNDDVAAAIDQALERAGATLAKKGPLDRLVGFRAKNFLLEYKTGRGKLRASQERFLLTWRGQADVVRTPEEALQAIGALP